jgi:hypothetical protein
VRSRGPASYHVTECRRSDADANFAIAGNRLFEISIDRCLARFQYHCCFHLCASFLLPYVRSFLKTAAWAGLAAQAATGFAVRRASALSSSSQIALTLRAVAEGVSIFPC